MDGDLAPITASELIAVWTEEDRSLLQTFIAAVEPLGAERLAARLSGEFDTLGALFSASPGRLARAVAEGRDGQGFIRHVNVCSAIAARALQQRIDGRRILTSWPALISYLRASLQYEIKEQTRILFLDKKNALIKDEVAGRGPNNTILDNCHVYTAFAALDPLTQDKVSKLTGSTIEWRRGRSGPGWLGGGRSAVSRNEVERPLMEPGEVRALDDDEQLVFAAGRKPLRTRKLLYDRRAPFRRRARIPAPDQEAGPDVPPHLPHPWAGRRALGRDEGVSLPLFKEVTAAIDDRKAAARAGEIYSRVAEEMAAQQAALDQLQGRQP